MPEKKSHQLLGSLQKIFELALAFAWLTLVLLVVFFAFGQIIYSNAVLPRIWFGGEYLGGTPLSQLGPKVSAISEEFLKKPLVVVVNKQSFTKFPKALAVNIDTAKATKRIASYGRGGRPGKSLREQLELLLRPVRINEGISFNPKLVKDFASSVAGQVSRQEADAYFVLSKGRLKIAPAQKGRGLSSALVEKKITKKLLELDQAPIQVSASRLIPKISEPDLKKLAPRVEKIINYPLVLEYLDKRFQPSKQEIFSWLEPFAKLNSGAQPHSLELMINPYKVANYLKTIAPEINQKPVNAKLTIEGGKVKVFQPAKEGRKLNFQSSVAKIIRQLILQAGGPLALEVVVAKPAVKDSKIDELGIKTLLGKASTSFAGSPKNRVHNIENGARFLNGILIKPGEVFSTVGALGAIDNSSGYLPELVIKGNRTIPEYGGGLCQVSTTLFRAALDAGLPIVERRNHSYRVSYYERGVGPGLDATIYLPRPDLKIKNDTTGWLLIQSFVNGKEVNFEIYGTDDKRISKIEGPYTSNYRNPPPAEYEETDTLSEGEEKQIEKPHAGATSVAYYKVYNADGSLRHEQTFKSKYKALPARFLRGVAPKQE